MNQHAVNAFVQGHEDLGPRFVILDLTRLASSVLSKLAKYLGWEDWVFDLTTWRFHAKSLIPNGLVKTTRIPPARSLAGPATLYSGLDEIEVNLLEFCAATSRIPLLRFACTNARQIHVSFVPDERLVVITCISTSFRLPPKAEACYMHC